MNKNSREFEEVKRDFDEWYKNQKEINPYIMRDWFINRLNQELQKAQAEVKYEVIKLLAGNTPIYEKRKASAYNEGVTSGWYAAREFIRLELNAQQIQSELDHFNK